MELYGKGKMVYLLIVLLAYFVNRWWRTPDIPEHMLGQRVHFIPEFLDVSTAKELLELIKSMKTFPSNANDLLFYNTTHEHVGEAEALGADGKCANKFLIPNRERTLCILPGRFDVVRHYLKHGGLEGFKENYEAAVSRLQSFGVYMFDLVKFPVVEKLFTSKKFVETAKTVCPTGKQVLDPFQFNFIIQVPGQTVPLHIDAPYFTDATRFQYPQWLLAVMVFSGLYQNKFIDQIQVVSYLHEWNSTSRGGQFAFWNENAPKGALEQPFPRAASLVDGSKMVHAATVYHTKRHPPVLPKDATNKLVYKSQDQWEILSDDHTLRRYKTDDLRITIVYRARCFESEEKKKTFNDWYRTSENVRPVEDILEELKLDLASRGEQSIEKLNVMKPLDLALTLLDEYVRYPMPSHAILPYNYCLLPEVAPWTASLINRVC